MALMIAIAPLFITNTPIFDDTLKLADQQTCVYTTKGQTPFYKSEPI
jgi:hypothetical protein